MKIIRDIHRYFGRDYRLDQLFPMFSPGLFSAPLFRLLALAHPLSVRHHDFDKWYPRASIESLAADFERENKRKPVEIRKKWLEQRAAEHVRVQEVRTGDRAASAVDTNVWTPAVRQYLRRMGAGDALQKNRAKERGAEGTAGRVRFVSCVLRVLNFNVRC